MNIKRKKEIESDKLKIENKIKENMQKDDYNFEENKKELTHDF